MKMKSRSHRYNINRTRPGHGHKNNKNKKCLHMMMFICIKQHLYHLSIIPARFQDVMKFISDRQTSCFHLQ